LEEQVIAPVYAQIALDIASRIANGEIKENTKIHGRSVMASQYGVSPETIRRSLKLLEDMQVIEIQHNSGAVVLSAEQAKRYVSKFSDQNNLRNHKKSLRSLLAEQERIVKKITEEADTIIRMNEKFSISNPFNPYESEVLESSPLIGKTLSELKFWQETGATIIAIRRDGNIILSPGPYAILLAGDTLVFVGELKTAEAVNEFLNRI
jgi:K+/H+ antiporter YhaU regulatory subunit KhtT